MTKLINNIQQGMRNKLMQWGNAHSTIPLFSIDTCLWDMYKKLKLTIHFNFNIYTRVKLVLKWLDY